MIIYSINGKKTYETNTVFPDGDWTGKAEFIVDETKKENALIVEKIRKYAPYFEVVANSSGAISDIIKTADKPETEEEQTPDVPLEVRIAQMEAQIAEMKAQLSAQKGEE